MSLSRKKRIRKKTQYTQKPLSLLGAAFIVIVTTGVGLYHFVSAYTQLEPVYLEIDPNIGLQVIVEEFFLANDAPEMIPIIKCESNFRHYATDGTVLKNRAGSSAVGIAQILTSAHPDPKAVDLFNKRHNTDVAVEDLDVTTLEGNLGYALMLYELRGTKDWECAKKFRFSS